MEKTILYALFYEMYTLYRINFQIYYMLGETLYDRSLRGWGNCFAIFQNYHFAERKNCFSRFVGRKCLRSLEKLFTGLKREKLCEDEAAAKRYAMNCNPTPSDKGVRKPDIV